MIILIPSYSFNIFLILLLVILATLSFSLIDINAQHDKINIQDSNSSLSPTHYPISSPTAQPTKIPLFIPTYAPTIEPTPVPSDSKVWTVSVSFTIKDLTQESFEESQILQNSFRSALSNVLSVPLDWIGNPIASTAVFKIYNLLALNIPVTSKYDDINTKTVISDKLKEFLSSFVSLAESKGYDSSLANVKVIIINFISFRVKLGNFYLLNCYFRNYTDNWGIDFYIISHP